VAQRAAQRAKEQELRAALRQIRGALDEYKRAFDDGRIARAVDASGYPPTLDTLVDGVPLAKDPARRRLYFLRRIPRDPFCEDAGVPAAQTWGQRSYDSPPDSPAPGRDVFDVYSTTPRHAIDGTALSQW
jgi:general secretion pathway protein G